MQQKFIIITGNDEDFLLTISKQLFPNLKDCRYNFIELDKFTTIVCFPYYKMEKFGSLFRFPTKFENQRVIFCSKGEQLYQIQHFVKNQQLQDLIKVVWNQKNYFDAFHKSKNINYICDEIKNWLQYKNNKLCQQKQHFIEDDTLYVIEQCLEKQRLLLININGAIEKNNIGKEQEQFLKGLLLPDALAYFQFVFYILLLFKNSYIYLQFIIKYYCKNCKILKHLWSNQNFSIQYSDKGLQVAQTNKKCICPHQNFIVQQGNGVFQKRKPHQLSQQNEQIEKLRFIIEKQLLLGYFDLYNPISQLKKENEAQQLVLSQKTFVDQSQIIKNEWARAKEMSNSKKQEINVLFLSVEDMEKNKLFSRLNKKKIDEKNNKALKQYLEPHQKFFQDSVIEFNNLCYFNSPALSMGDEEENMVQKFRCFFQQIAIDFLFVCVVYQRTDIMKSRINQIVKKFVGVAKDQIGIIVMNYNLQSIQMQEDLKMNLIKQFRCVLFEVENGNNEHLIFEIEKQINSLKKSQIDISNTEFACETLEDRRLVEEVEKKLKLMQTKLESKQFKISYNKQAGQNFKFQNNAGKLKG